MKNRLQFNRHYAVSPNREEALNALRARITDRDFIPLIGEPIVFRYEDENGNVQLILAIGKKAGRNLNEREYHVIDTADLDEKIAAEVAAREELDAETIKKVIFDGVESEFANNVATLSVSANSIPVGGDYESHIIQDNPEGLPHPIHKHYSTEDAIKQLDINFADFLDKTDAKINGLHIVKVTSGLDANVREAYDFVNEDGLVQPNSDRILIYKDSALYNVYLGHVDDYLADYSEPVVTPGTGDTALCFIYQKADGKYQLVPINVESFLEESEFLDGLDVNNHEVRVKTDPASETFLTVGSDGVKLSGVQDAIDAAQQAEEDRAVAAEEAIQAELDATQAGAGLAADGSYIHDHPTKYIDSATSLANADHLLDAALNELSSSTITAVQNLQNNIDAEQARATSAENSLDNKISELSANTMAADQILQDNINAEEARAIDAENALQAELDTTQAGAGLNADGTYHKHNTAGDMGKYIAMAESLDEATVMLDSAVADLSANTIAATASLDSKIDELSANTMAADQVLQNNIDAEANRAQSAESTLQDNIDAEATRAQNAESALDSKISALSAGTESEITRLDNKIDAETQRATTAENTINSRVDELSGATMAFSSATVSEIARIDAAASRNKVKSTGHTIVVTEGAEGTNLEANIDGKTILSDNGELKTGLKVAALAPGELEANVREAFRLVDDRGIPVDNTIVKIYKSSSLEKVELVNVEGVDYVRITYIDNSGATQTMDVNIQKLIFEAEFKDGLIVNNAGEVRVKIDPASDPYLTVSQEGVKLSGIESALRSISSVTDNIISACGLNIGGQGGYVPHDETHYIKNARSLDQADVLLDAGIWAVSGVVSNISGATAQLSANTEAAINQLSANTYYTIRELSAGTIQLSADTYYTIQNLSGGVTELINSSITVISGAVVEYVAEALSGINFDEIYDYIDSGDTVINERIDDIEGIVAAALNDLNKRVKENKKAIEENSGVTIVSGDVISLSAATVHISGDVTNLSAATVEIDGRIYDIEKVVAAAFNDLNDRVKDNKEAIEENSAVTANLSGIIMTISAKTSGVLTLNLNDVEQGKYSPSASTTIDFDVTGAIVPLTGYKISSGVTEKELVIVSSDTVNDAFGKLQKQIYDDEIVIAGAFNDIDERILELSGRTVDLSNYYTKAEVDEKIASGGTFDPTLYYTKVEVNNLVSSITIVDSARTSYSAITSLSAQTSLSATTAGKLGHNVNIALSGDCYGSAITNFEGNVLNIPTFKKFTTANSLTNLNFAEYLTVVATGDDAILTIAADANLPKLPAGGVKEAHLIIENTGSTGIIITINNSDSRLRITGDNEFLIDPNSIGELNALITYNGSTYTIYIITT